MLNFCLRGRCIWQGVSLFGCRSPAVPLEPSTCRGTYFYCIPLFVSCL